MGQDTGLFLRGVVPGQNPIPLRPSQRRLEPGAPSGGVVMVLAGLVFSLLLPLSDPLPAPTLWMALSSFVPLVFPAAQTQSAFMQIRKRCLFLRPVWWPKAKSNLHDFHGSSPQGSAQQTLSQKEGTVLNS